MVVGKIFCHECGNKLTSNEDFCPECGHKRIKSVNNTQQTSTTHTQQVPSEQSEQIELVNDGQTVEGTETEDRVSQPEKQRKPWSLWQKIISSLAVILVLMALGSHYTLKAMTSPEKQITPLYNALISNDKESIFEYISIPTNTNYDKDAYIEYLNGQNMENILVELQQKADLTVKDGITRIIHNQYGEELFKIVKLKKYGFYSTIDISAIHKEYHFTTDLTEGELTLADKKFALEQPVVKLGNWLPGVYNAVISLDNDIVPSALNFNVTIDSGKSGELFSLSKNQYMISLDAEEPDSMLFINGKSTGKTIEELKEIGPYFNKEALMLHVEKETPSGEVAKSEKVQVTGGDRAYFYYSYGTSFEEKTPEDYFSEVDLSEFVVDFRDAYEESLNYRDFSYIAPFLSKGSTAYKELVKFVGDLKNEEYEYDFISNKVTDVEFSLTEGIVTTFEEFVFTNHLGKVTNYEREKEYFIELNDYDEYKIHTIDIKDTVRETGKN